MSIATEITRLQGIKSDIRTALVTQGISQASSHNMADFSADILAIQGSGGEGVYITVTCNVEYQGYDIILSANETELDRKQCPSSLVVNFFVSADDIALPTTFVISNSLNDITTSVTANMYGWYDLYCTIPLVPALTGNTGKEFSSSIQASNKEPWRAFTDNWSQTGGWSSNQFSNAYIGYAFDEPVSVTRVDFRQNSHNSNYGVKTYSIEYSDDGSTYYPATETLNALLNTDRQTISLDDKGFHKYWRMFIFNSTGTSSLYTSLKNLQFYGR